MTVGLNGASAINIKVDITDIQNCIRLMQNSITRVPASDMTALNAIPSTSARENEAPNPAGEDLRRALGLQEIQASQR